MKRKDFEKSIAGWGNRNCWRLSWKKTKVYLSFENKEGKGKEFSFILTLVLNNLWLIGCLKASRIYDVLEFRKEYRRYQIFSLYNVSLGDVFHYRTSSIWRIFKFISWVMIFPFGYLWLKQKNVRLLSRYSNLFTLKVQISECTLKGASHRGARLTLGSKKGYCIEKWDCHFIPSYKFLTHFPKWMINIKVFSDCLNIFFYLLVIPNPILGNIDMFYYKWCSMTIQLKG